MAHTFVKDVMKKDVIELDGSVSIQDAASKMINEKIGCVIVTENDKHVGILTEKDTIYFNIQSNVFSINWNRSR